MAISQRDHADLKDLLEGTQGPAVVRVLSRLGSGLAADASDLSLLPVLSRLGLGEVTHKGFKLSGFGYRCADSAREYVLWQDRGRKLHWEDSLPALSIENFRHKRVLEVGPGWGCNLFRLRSVTREVRGCEIEPAYLLFTSAFARLERVEPPKIDIASAEGLPYPDGQFDWVLLFSTLQYTDVRRAVSEFARVLAPGGCLLTSQPLLSTLIGDLASVRSTLSLRRKLIALANSISYNLSERRLKAPKRGNATSRPVYLTKRRIMSIAERAGLHVLQDLSAYQSEGREFVLIARKER